MKNNITNRVFKILYKYSSNIYFRNKKYDSRLKENVKL